MCIRDSASSIFLFYAGMEMMGIHVMDVKNPGRNYPRAIIIGSLDVYKRQALHPEQTPLSF